MQYICYKRFKGRTLSQDHANIPYGTTFETAGSFLLDSDNKPMMTTTCYNCHKHFSRNDDGQGLRRGKLAYAIAYAPRGDKYRFSEEETTMLTRDYQRFLKPTETILFNDDFFNAEVSELEELAKKLDIRVKI
jgi:hypothetical protein